MPAKSLELKHTIKLIRELDNEIDEIEAEIKIIMNEINSPILSIPGINYRIGAMIIAEIGDFSRFDFLIRYLLMQECLPLPTNQDNLIIVIPIWKNVVPGIFDTPFITQPNMFVIGMKILLHILPRNEPKGSIIMLLIPCIQETCKTDL